MPRILDKESPRIKTYVGFNKIEQWVIRNLMTNGNCCMSQKKFLRGREDFELLFGKNNMAIETTNADCIILSINKRARNKAIKIVLI